MAQYHLDLKEGQFSDILEKMTQLTKESSFMLTDEELDIFNSSCRIKYDSLVKEYNDNVDKIGAEAKLVKFYNEILAVVHNLKSSTSSDWQKSQYSNMVADFSTFLSDVLLNVAVNHYRAVLATSVRHLPIVHPTRLLVSLNYCKVCYKMFGKDQAIDIGLEALRNAREVLKTKEETISGNGAEVMIRLRQQLLTWGCSEDILDSKLD